MAEENQKNDLPLILKCIWADSIRGMMAAEKLQRFDYYERFVVIQELTESIAVSLGCLDSLRKKIEISNHV